MLSNTLDRISFWSLFVVVVLLPLFFLPFTKIPIETSKGLLLVMGLAVSIIFWAAARFSDGKIVLPRSWFLVSGLGIVLVFLLSALFSATLKVSFFGTMFDMGTFWFMLGAFLLMLMSSILFKDSKNAKTVFLGVALSSILVLVFQILHLFLPNMLSLGILAGKTDNLLGSWNALAIFAGLFAVISIFFLEFFSVSRLMKIFFYILVVLSVLLVALVNFPTVWIILGIFALLVFIYKVSFSIGSHVEGKQRSFPAISFIVVMISLIFVMSGTLIGGFLPNLLGISNTEVRPSFVTTMSVTKSVLVKSPILGAGPNKFTEAWNMYKPQAINNSIFWNTSFNQGSGLLPTFATTTGILGILAWLVFLALLLFTGFKLFSSVSHKDESLNIEMAMFYMMSFYLFIVALFYPIGPSLFLLAFAFLGVFIGLSVFNKEKGEMVISFLNDTRKSFFAILLLIVIMMASVSIVFKYTERFVSIIYFQKAVAADTIEKAESDINKAVSLYQNDLYLRTYAQVYLLKANSLVSSVAKGGTLTDAEKADLQTSFDQATKSAQLAVTYNQMNYLNFEMLGSIYETSISFGATGAFDKAVSAYQSASTFNPLNPILKLDLARLYFGNKDTQKAKDLANEALTLKPDYVDALIFLSQVARSEGNNTDAISYAEQAVNFYPQDTSLKQYLDSLKNGSASASVPSTPAKQ